MDIMDPMDTRKVLWARQQLREVLKEFWYIERMREDGLCHGVYDPAHKQESQMTPYEGNFVKLMDKCYTKEGDLYNLYFKEVADKVGDDGSSHLVAVELKPCTIAAMGAEEVMEVCLGSLMTLAQQLQIASIAIEDFVSQAREGQRNHG